MLMNHYLNILSSFHCKRNIKYKYVCHLELFFSRNIQNESQEHYHYFGIPNANVAVHTTSKSILYLQ